MKVVGKNASEVKAKWKRMNMLNKIKRILIYEWKVTIWNGLTEKKAIDLFLRHKGIKAKGRSTIEKMYLILKNNDPILNKSIRKPRGVNDYKLYLRSKEWQDKRQMMFNLRGKKCELCGTMEGRMQLHHLHYRTLYKETPQDLMILCGGCHQHWHDVNDLKKVNMTFNQFWELYDYKVGRKKAERAWNKLNQLNKMAIANHLPRYVANTYKDGTYPSRKHPSTYLNQESWNDEITEIKPRNAGGVSKDTERRIKDMFGPEPGGTNPQNMGGTVWNEKARHDDSEEDITFDTVVLKRNERPIGDFNLVWFSKL